MYYYHTNDEIDEIGEGIIRKYNYQAFIQGDPTDIEGFIADHLNYRIVYDRLADKDAGRMAFLADGKDTMWVWRDGSVGYGGCTYCNNQTFNPAYCHTGKSVTQQLEEGKRFFVRKYPEMKYLAYFQAYTNTYGELEELKRK